MNIKGIQDNAIYNLNMCTNITRSSKCEVTKPHIIGLRAAIKEASKRYKIEKNLNEQFKEVENIKNIMTSEKLNKVEEDYILVQSAREINEMKNMELKQNIEETLMEIEAKGVADLTKTDRVEHKINFRFDTNTSEKKTNSTK